MKHPVRTIGAEVSYYDANSQDIRADRRGQSASLALWLLERGDIIPANRDHRLVCAQAVLRSRFTELLRDQSNMARARGYATPHSSDLL